MKTMKRRFISGIAALCTLMILIGIIPTSVFDRVNVNAANAETGWTVYLDASSTVSWYYNDKCRPAVKGDNSEFNVMSQISPNIYTYTFDNKPQTITFSRHNKDGDFNTAVSDNITGNYFKLNFDPATGSWSTNNTYEQQEYYSITVDFTNVDISEWGDLSTISIYGCNSWDDHDEAPCFMDKISDKKYQYNYLKKPYETILIIDNNKFSNNTWQTEDIEGIVWNNENEVTMEVGSLEYTRLNGNVRMYKVGDIECKSPNFEGEILQFKDMTRKADNVQAVFSVTEDFNNTKIENLVSNSVTVPKNTTTEDQKAYKYVKFYVDGQMTEAYSIKDSINKGGTFYYGATEKSDNTKVSYWGESVTSLLIDQKSIYLDNMVFPIDNSRKPTVQIGSRKLSLSEFGDNNKAYKFEVSNIKSDDVISVIYNGTTYNFIIGNNTDKDMLILDGEIVQLKEIYSDSRKIYFDATLSKLKCIDTLGSMPLPNGAIYAHLFNNAGANTTKEMSKAAAHTSGSNTWNDVYYIVLTDEEINIYDKIIFFSGYDNANWPSDESMCRTGNLDLPKDQEGNITEQNCFYADASVKDDTNAAVGPRGGYWGQPYTIRDAESGKGTDVVDIEQKIFTKDITKLYVDSTWYDYYSDYELNGNNKDSYTTPFRVSHSTWVPFRQFDQALSDYYQTNGVQYPLYTGHFQAPVFAGDTLRFQNIQNALLLYGYGDGAFNGDFYVNNNSISSKTDTIAQNNERYAYTVQGLVNNSLKNKQSLMTSDNKAELPHFNKSFLLGNNSKNTKLGEVYENVSFPFTKKDIFNNGVQYWWFDSNRTTLLMAQDSDTGRYYLDSQNSLSDNCLNLDSGSNRLTKYGLFPFNSRSTTGNANTYNYGYGVKLEFKFRLTNDGRVKDENDNDVPIQFMFSGDDDVWVYIDGKLVLDVGGAHGEAQGLIDFADKKSYVSKVKAGAATENNSSGVKKSITYNDGSSTYNYTFEDVKDFSDVFLDNNGNSTNTSEHTLTMYYMERGMWESNMKVAFNFPDENKLEVEKVVDTKNVNEEFKDFFNAESLFTFDIRNLATHYGTQEAVSGSTTKPVTVTSLSGGQNVIESENNIDVGYYLTKNDNCNTFETTDAQGRTGVIHWYANKWNEEHKYTSGRLGNIKLKQAIDISEMEQLRFNMCTVNSPITIGGIYICLTDQNGKTASAFLSPNNIDGIPSTTAGSWVTFKVMLSKLNYSSGFDKTKVKTISFQYDQDENKDLWTDVYLDQFIFQPVAKLPETVGFRKEQKLISDYGSAQSGQLEAPVGAIYSKSSSGRMQTMVDSKFTLGNKNQVTFYDQFRRGSYISLKEELTPSQELLFTTSHTLYEDGIAIGGVSGDYTTVSGGCDSLTNVKDTVTIDETQNEILNNHRGTWIDDGRTEKIITVDSSNEDPSIGNAYNGNKPENIQNTDTIPQNNTFVFRSYADPDNIQSSTTLRAVFTNTVRVSSLVIEKQQPESDDQNHPLTGKYRFYVEFTNIGGISLTDSNERSSVIMGPFDLEVGESYRIDGIPVGTEYTIHEVVSRQNEESDQAVVDNILGYVEQTEPTVTNRVDFIKDKIEIEGVEYNTWAISSNVSYETTKAFKYRFYNVFMPTISLKLEKNWAGVPEDYTLPDSLTFKLERYGTVYEKDFETGEMTPVIENGEVKKAWQEVPGQSEITLMPNGSGEWTLIINDLNKYVNGQNLIVDADGNVTNDSTTEKWAYRVTEQTSEDFPFTVTYSEYYGENGIYNAVEGNDTPAVMTVTNTYKHLIIMPETGGDGTSQMPFNFILFGAIAILLAGGIFLFVNKGYIVIKNNK